MTSRVWLLGITLLCAPGCVNERTVPYQYRVPLESNSRGQAAAVACLDDCHALYADGSNEYFTCLQMCPDAQVIAGSACTGERPDMPPATFCYTRLVKESQSEDAAGEAFGELFLKLIGATVEAIAKGSQDSHGSSTASTSEESHRSSGEKAHHDEQRERERQRERRR